ncbi:MAG: cupredoxin family protein [Hydrogenophilales bacterium]|nr:cupredoxin family protein [Hydrogenophilales bacterium]
MKTKPYLLLPLAFAASAALAHGNETHEQKPAIEYAKAEDKAFGKAADPRRATRTMTVEMSDAMRFTPAEISVKRGETVKFIIKNQGKIMHEMVLGTMAELKEHGAAMKKFPGMEHDEPYMAHVAPGKSGEMGWQFTRAGEFYYACLLPGHFEAGMVGKIIVK